jgi:hypothetical protein
MSKLSKVDMETEKMINQVWTHILNFINYTGDDNVTITAKKIKESGKTWNGKEGKFPDARNVVYQMTAHTRPEILKNYKVLIFPIMNGTYILTKANIYNTLDYTHEPSETVKITRDTSSLVLRPVRILNERFYGHEP